MPDDLDPLRPMPRPDLPDVDRDTPTGPLPDQALRTDTEEHPRDIQR